ncbi:hypothetical protein [Nocardia sp. NPDC056564]|uniref:hypothetical protein n=1 Tax=Nocardia sp. NPDC056564 TaxID=3345865 RepID=UPI00366D8EFA
MTEFQSGVDRDRSGGIAIGSGWARPNRRRPPGYIVKKSVRRMECPLSWADSDLAADAAVRVALPTRIGVGGTPLGKLDAKHRPTGDDRAPDGVDRDRSGRIAIQ